MSRAVALTALLVCSGCVDIVGANVEGRYVEREEKRFQISGKAEVALSTFDGSIEVRPWTRSEVEVVIEKRGADKSAIDKIQVAANQAGDRVTVEVKHPHREGGFHFGPSARAKLIVSLPESSDLVAKSGDGSIDVERLAGRIELRSGDGSIRARELAGDVTAETGDGSIMDCAARVRMDTQFLSTTGTIRWSPRSRTGKLSTFHRLTRQRSGAAVR